MKPIVIGCLLALTLGITGLSTDSFAKRKRKKQRNLIKKEFRSKARFGKSAKSKKRGKWVKIATVKARSKLMAETLGKRIPIMCRLTKGNSFECEVRGPKGAALVTESAAWPAGRMRLRINIQKVGISLELSNKWKKYIRTKARKKR